MTISRFEERSLIQDGQITNVKGLPSPQNPLNVKSPQPRKKIKEGVPKEELVFGTIINPGHVAITLPIRTYSPNQYEPWQKKAKREKAQKRAVMFAMIPIKETHRDILSLPCTVRLTRFAPKFLDAHDNLPMSQKKILDQTCAEITGDFVPGRADSYAGFTFQYDQVKSKVYGIKIEIIKN